MKITICGSMAHEPKMAETEKLLRELGYETEKPNIVEGHIYEDDLDANATLKRGFIDEHFKKIDSSDAILVINEDKGGIVHYIGGNTLIEMAHAYSQGLEIFVLNSLPDVSYRSEIAGMHPIILGGDIHAIDEYILSLPTLFIGSESPVKHLALSRGFRRAGIRVRLQGFEVTSGVNEQPFTVEESYEGAVNRHKNLIEKTDVLAVDGDYRAIIESGFHTFKTGHNMFGCAAIILEKVGGPQKVGIDVDLEFPRAMTNEIPEKYPDIGVLVQKKFNSKLKDPYPFFTGDKLTRAKVLENAIYNVAIQF